MRRIAVIVLAGSMLASCASLQNAYNAATGASVSPTTVIVAANTFDALEATATNYLKLPKCAPATRPICRDPAATKAIIPAVRSGRVARTNLEQFFKNNPGQLGPSGLYKALTASISTLQGVYAQYNIGASK